MPVHVDDCKGRVACSESILSVTEILDHAHRYHLLNLRRQLMHGPHIQSYVLIPCWVSLQ